MSTGQGPAAAERGRAEFWILLLTAGVLGFAFLWGLVLHQKPPRSRKAATSAAVVPSTSTPTGTTVPPTLPPPRNYKTVSQVNIRQGPATNTTVLGQLPKNATVAVECRTTGESVTSSLGNTDQWLRIYTPAGDGYVSALYVDVGNDIANAKRIGICTKK